MPRVVPPARRPATGPAPDPVRAGLMTAAWAALAGLLLVVVPVLLVWATDGRTGADAAQALRTAGQVWLVAHAAPLEVPGGRFGLAPLGLLLVPLGALVGAGAHAARAGAATTLRSAGRLTVVAAGAYAVLTTAVAALAAGDGVRPDLPAALLCGLAVGGLGAGAGALRGAGLVASAWAGVPAWLRRVLPAVGAALAVLGAASAVLVGACLALSFGDAVELARAGAPGVVGGAALLLLGLSLVPNALVWGASWLAGPGFAVGTGTAVGPFDHQLDALPALPLLAALPGGPLSLWVAVLVLLVPLTAGGVAGLLLVRRSSPAPLRDACLVGLSCGAVLAALGWLSGGPVGGGRLAETGPSPWRLGLAVAIQVGLGAALVVLLRSGRDEA